ncbi:hypothetical protein HK097_010304 [Rhizophlyctis rosea]|uniref:Uncharacterized protein n=1 Tax=Rhizophlyctis rosea TaxID=64517 RepID=A0AAD5S7T9_9FUNG|nr:hypothetical protein HK097_010304 [Rhizophlyctis rosea]
MLTDSPPTLTGTRASPKNDHLNPDKLSPPSTADQATSEAVAKPLRSHLNQRSKELRKRERQPVDPSSRYVHTPTRSFSPSSPVASYLPGSPLLGHSTHQSPEEIVEERRSRSSTPPPWKKSYDSRRAKYTDDSDATLSEHNEMGEGESWSEPGSGDDHEPIERPDDISLTKRPKVLSSMPSTKRNRSATPPLPHNHFDQPPSTFQPLDPQRVLAEESSRLDRECSTQRSFDPDLPYLTSKHVYDSSSYSKEYDHFIPSEAPHLNTGGVPDDDLDKLLEKRNGFLDKFDPAKEEEAGEGGDAAGEETAAGGKKKKKKKPKKKKGLADGEVVPSGVVDTGRKSKGRTAMAAESDTAPLLHGNDGCSSGSATPEPGVRAGADVSEILEHFRKRLPDDLGPLKEPLLRQAKPAQQPNASKSKAWANTSKSGQKSNDSPASLSKTTNEAEKPTVTISPAPPKEDKRPKPASPADSKEARKTIVINTKDLHRTTSATSPTLTSPADSKGGTPSPRGSVHGRRQGPPVTETRDEAAAEVPYFSELQTLSVSSLVPPSLYGALFDEILKMQWDITGAARRPDVMINPQDRYNRPDYTRWVKQDEQREDINRATRASLTVNLQCKPGVTPIPPKKMVEGLVEFMRRMVKSSAMSFAEWEIQEVVEARVDQLCMVCDAKPWSNVAFDGSDKRLPPKARAEDRMSKTEIFYTNPELPQIVFVAARLKFAIPILRRLTEPVIEQRGRVRTVQRCELLGLKYLSDLQPYIADYLNPFWEETHPQKYARAAELLTSVEGVEGGYMIMVFRMSDGFRKVSQVVDGYLSSYESIEFGTKDAGPEFGRRGGRRRADSKLSPASPLLATPPNPDVLTPSELLMLNALVFKDVKICYQLVSLFFRDAELIPGDPGLWDDCQFHPFDFLCNPFISKSMLSPPPFLSTVCIIKSPLFPQLGKILTRLCKEGFSLSGLKMTRIGPATSHRLLDDRNSHSLSTEVADAFVNDVSDGPSLVFCLQRENAVKRWCEVIDDIRSRLSNGPRKKDLMFGGVYASTSFHLAVSQKGYLFPEGVTVTSRAIPKGDKYLKTLSPVNVTDVPKFPRRCFPTYQTRRDSISSTSSSSVGQSGITSRTSSPPPQHGPEVVTMILLPVKDCFEDNVDLWSQILDACVTVPAPVPATAPAPAESETAEVVDAPAKSGRKGRGKTKHNKGAYGLSSTTAKAEHEWDVASDVAASDVGSSTGGGAGSSWALQPMKLVGCKYLICGYSVIEKWRDTRGRWRDKEAVRRDDEACDAMRHGPCLALALEHPNALEHLKIVLERFPPEVHCSVIHSETSEETLVQAPIFFGELFDSSHRIVMQQPGPKGGVVGGKAGSGGGGSFAPMQ